MKAYAPVERRSTGRFHFAAWSSKHRLDLLCEASYCSLQPIKTVTDHGRQCTTPVSLLHVSPWPPRPPTPLPRALRRSRRRARPLRTLLSPRWSSCVAFVVSYRRTRDLTTSLLANRKRSTTLETLASALAVSASRSESACLVWSFSCHQLAPRTTCSISSVLRFLSCLPVSLLCFETLLYPFLMYERPC